MARTWLSVTVELLGGRGEELWPYPGRVFAVGPSHTFLDLANAVNEAFGRWDRSHLSMFTLADGRVVTDEETGAEMAGATGGPVMAPLDIASAEVAGVLAPGAEFQLTFDLGDSWTHRCVVAEQKVDPHEVLGIHPDAPLPYWGWGNIPDQYGRRWADDDGRSRAPKRPSRPHPMLLHAWPGQDQVPSLDLSELRVAIADGDADRFLATVTGRDVDDALQQVGAGIPMDMLGSELEGDVAMSTGGYIDLHTGEVYDDDATDPMMVGEEAAIDVEGQPDRWLRFDRIGSREAGGTWRAREFLASRGIRVV